MLVPVGVASLIGMRLTLRADTKLTKIQLDWTGFLALATAMAAVQLVLARGVRLDWFESTEIIVECLVAALAFYVFIVHCLTTKAPFLNLRLLADRNYAIGLVLVTIYGMLNFTPMVLLPPLLQQHVGFSDALVGQVIGCRGIGMTVGFLTGGHHEPVRSAHRHEARVFHPGALRAVDAHLRPQRHDGNPGLNSLVQGFAVGIIWVPLTDRRVRHAGAERPRRGLLGVPPVAQYRLELFHLAVDRRDRARDRRQLQPHDRDDHALQTGPGHAEV